MTEDSRCCGTGTCMINAEGRCWCGQQWDGDTLYRPSTGLETPAAKPVVAESDMLDTLDTKDAR